MMSYSSLFRMPTPMKITGRSSSITNAFISSIIPVIQPTEAEIKKALSILGMTPETFQCSYCGATASEWDHLRPLVLDKRPTGYLSEIRNLVPACGKCNQSKGNREWREWIRSDAKLSPKTKGIADLDEKVERLADYENWGKPSKIDFESILDRELWKQHWNNHERVQNAMRESQELAEQIRKKVASTHNSR
uniref:HNH endonuclease n=1 Tax=Candidatus Kentrum sp. DK TaxID=2126562 RepID=A0A450SLY1_9GAMM|nr:MAG: HNH endonuclease [Candidatus Kentron sp. DK]